MIKACKGHIFFATIPKRFLWRSQNNVKIQNTQNFILLTIALLSFEKQIVIPQTTHMSQGYNRNMKISEYIMLIIYS